MTFEQYQIEWNALKKGVQDCSVKVHLAIECLIAMKYTALEAETEIENWLFEAQIEAATPIYHKVSPSENVIDNRVTTG